MRSWPTRGGMEKLIDTHFQQLIDKLNEILTELKKQAKARS
jgi:hypothetical protein